MGRSRPPGETSGSPQRPAQRLAEALLTVDLGAELEQLRKEEAWQHGDHNAKTLVKAPDFRIVLIAVKSGGRLKEHYASARLAIQTISGRLRLHLPDQTIDLPAGHLLVLEREIAHDVEALEESAFLLTLAWPGERSAAG
jgi:quercetin dioxygenase-like cupin family protein